MNLAILTLNNTLKFIVKTPVQYGQRCFQNIWYEKGHLSGGFFWWKLRLYFQALVSRIFGQPNFSTNKTVPTLNYP